MEDLDMRRFKVVLYSLYSKKQCEDDSFVFDNRDKIIPKVKAFFECCGYEVLDKSVVFISNEVIYKDLFRALLIKKFLNKDRYIKKTDKGEYFDDYLFLNTTGKIDNDVLEVEDLYSIYLGKSFRKGGYMRDWSSDEEFDYEYLGAVIRKHLCILAGENYQIFLDKDRYDGLLLYVFRRNFDAGNISWIFFLGEKLEFYRLYPRTCEYLLKVGVIFYDLEEGRRLQREDLFRDVKIDDFYELK